MPIYRLFASAITVMLGFNWSNKSDEMKSILSLSFFFLLEIMMKARSPNAKYLQQKNRARRNVCSLDPIQKVAANSLRVKQKSNGEEKKIDMKDRGKCLILL